MLNMWKTMHARGSRSIERCQEAIEQALMDQTAIEDPEDMSIDPPSCRGAIKIAVEKTIENLDR